MVGGRKEQCSKLERERERERENEENIQIQNDFEINLLIKYLEGERERGREGERERGREGEKARQTDWQ